MSGIARPAEEMLLFSIKYSKYSVVWLTIPAAYSLFNLFFLLYDILCSDGGWLLTFFHAHFGANPAVMVWCSVSVKMKVY